MVGEEWKAPPLGRMASRSWDFLTENPTGKSSLYSFTLTPAVGASCPSTSLLLLVFYFKVCQSGENRYLTVVFICIFLITNEVEHLLYVLWFFEWPLLGHFCSCLLPILFLVDFVFFLPIHMTS